MVKGTFIGRIGKDAELKSTKTGENFAVFSVACDVGYGKNKSTVWVDCAIFGKRAESLAPWLKKGTAVTVFGEPSVRTYEGRDGIKAAMSCRVEDLAFQGSVSRSTEHDSAADYAMSEGSF